LSALSALPSAERARFLEIFGRGILYNDQAVTEFGSVQQIYRLSGFVIGRHPDVPTPPRFAGTGIDYQMDGLNSTDYGEQLPHLIFRDRTGNVSHIDLYTHLYFPFHAIFRFSQAGKSCHGTAVIPKGSGCSSGT
jgi:hypothetical protein